MLQQLTRCCCPQDDYKEIDQDGLEGTRRNRKQFVDKKGDIEDGGTGGMTFGDNTGRSGDDEGIVPANNTVKMSKMDDTT